MLFEYRNLQDCVNGRKGMDGAKGVFFDELLNYMLESTVTCISQLVTVPQQYLNVMHVFRYDENYKRRY